MTGEPRRGYDLPLTTQKWQLWETLLVLPILVFVLEWRATELQAEYGWFKWCVYLLMLVVTILELLKHFSKLHFVPEGIAVTLFSKTLRQFPRENIRFLGGISYTRKSREYRYICVCTRTLEEMAYEQNRRTAKMFRDAPTLPGWTENMARKFLWGYAASVNRALGFPRKDLLLIEWSPQRLELLQKMYPGIPWVDLTENKILDAEREIVAERIHLYR